VRGQEPRHVIGHLSGRSDVVPGALAAFHRGLKETGFVEGRNISIEFHWADGHYDRLPSLAAELVGHNVSVIWANDVPSAFAAKAATKTIPTVFTIGGDPVKVGLAWPLVAWPFLPRGVVYCEDCPRIMASWNKATACIGDTKQ
jgi:putative tryptophan/tyrosine transport system substrate-binding protein